MLVDKDTILPLVKNALCMLYNKDYDLLEMDVHEQTVAHRFAIYLEQIFKNNYDFNLISFDCEYNRYHSNNISPKRNRNEIECNNEINLIKPDIIIHQRGTQHNNICVFELKKSTRSSITKKRDEKKLCIMTSSQNDFNYKYGFTIIYSPKKLSLTLFINGKKASQNILEYKNMLLCERN